MGKDPEISEPWACTYLCTCTHTFTCIQENTENMCKREGDLVEGVAHQWAGPLVVGNTASLALTRVPAGPQMVPNHLKNIFPGLEL